MSRVSIAIVFVSVFDAILLLGLRRTAATFDLELLDAWLYAAAVTLFLCKIWDAGYFAAVTLCDLAVHMNDAGI